MFDKKVSEAAGGTRLKVPHLASCAATPGRVSRKPALLTGHFLAPIFLSQLLLHASSQLGGGEVSLALFSKSSCGSTTQVIFSSSFHCWLLDPAEVFVGSSQQLWEVMLFSFGR